MLLSDNCGSFAGGEIRSRQTTSGPIRCSARKATQYPLAPLAAACRERVRVRGLPAAWPVDLIPAQEAGFFVDFLNLPNGWSEGENRDEALAQAEDLQGVRLL